MKLYEILKAKEALKRLTETRFSNYKVLRDLVKIYKSVSAEFEFYAEQEKKNITAYAEKDEMGNPVFLADGRLKLKDASAKELFEAELSKLRETDVDGIVPISITESDFKTSDSFPTPSDMAFLEPFIKFCD